MGKRPGNRTRVLLAIVGSLSLLLGLAGLSRALSELSARTPLLVAQIALGVGLVMASLLLGMVLLARTGSSDAAKVAEANAERDHQAALRTEAEQALRDVQATLESRVQERTAALQRANEELDQALQVARAVTSVARCLLWYSHIEQGEDGIVHWDTQFLDEEAAKRVLPVVVPPGRSYLYAAYDSRIYEDRAQFQALANEALLKNEGFRAEFRCRMEDGSLRWFSEDVFIESRGEGRWWAVGVALDITDLKRLEDQLLQAQKLESVGRLAGGIAHDFNNLLTAILGFAELAQDECALDTQGQAYLGNIRQAAERATNLTRQLLAFARRQIIEPKVLNLNALILELDTLLRRLIGEHIELVFLPDENLHCVKVDAGQLEQILVNLVVNARDAMPDGGKITIETQNTLLDAEYAQQHTGVIPGEYVLLAVSDTGAGMDEAIRLHIFEPFFTTKEKGRGTGLGLATVYGIVKQAGGHIWLYSEPGEGATFKIYLPRTQVSAGAASSAPQPSGQRGGSETILLVEDEPAVRMLAVHALRGRGYTVLEARNGEEALRIVKGREHAIALLITDVVMPQMSGKELAERLQGICPTLKVLFASGYTENTIVHHGVLEPDIAFLSKPFTPSALAQKVRAMFDQSESASG